MKAYAMKIVQVTDTHLVGPGQSIYGIDPRARLDACFADINARHGDAAFCVLSGDLTDSGEAAAYRELRHALSALRLPYYVMIGNHDSRQTLLEALPETPADPDGFVQCALDTPAGRVLLLDTVEAGRHDGVFCTARADWLAGQLDEADDGPVYIFMHHPPFDIGIPSLDRIRLADPEAFVRAIEGRGNLRHIFFGHVHRPVSGSWRGIPFPRCAAQPIRWRSTSIPNRRSPRSTSRRLTPSFYWKPSAPWSTCTTISATRRSKAQSRRRRRNNATGITPRG